MRYNVIIILLLLLAASSAHAQSAPQLTQSAIVGGGGASASGAFRVEGTIGQGAIGESSGGAFTISGGFQAAVAGAPLPSLAISDVTRAEGNSGQTTFTFTVSLNSPAPADGVMFDIATSDATATAADNDYEPKSIVGVTIGEGASSYQFDVEVNGDAVKEINESFNVNVTNLTGATVSDAEGMGTILNDDGAPSTGQIIISEFRLRGPDRDGAGPETGELDEFIELYNNSDSDFIVVDSSPLPTLAARGWAIVSDDPLNPDQTELLTAKFVIPVGTRIPARGHFLVTNALGYSLSAYAAADVVADESGGDAASYNADIADGSGIALYRTGNPASFSPDNRLDTVGFNGSTFFEGMPLTPTGGITAPLQHSLARRLTTGLPQDTNDNEADFRFVEVDGATSNGRASIWGAPGPENSLSPIQRNATVKASLIEPTTSSTAPPNRVRSGQGGLSGSYGTLSIQRRFKNATGAPVTRLRFRVVDITTLNTSVVSAPQADLRVISSTGIVTNSQNAVVATVTGLTLETLPPQPDGGGLNSTLTAILPGGGLAPGSTIDVQFLLSVHQEGNFRFLVNVEALTGQPDVVGATKAVGSGKGKQRSN